ncbi:MAG TPA: response regulator transcription factor [Acidimicrobiales bacterium]|nr:response regulator transcription factor [Acidimicrobiales bacterium]
MTPSAPLPSPSGAAPTEVLVVEDDSTVSAIVCMALEQAGYAVRSVDNCESAREAMQALTPAVLVMDLGLPDGNGLDILRDVIPQAEGGPAVVVLSGFRQERNVLAAFEAGANDFMVKPFSPHELVARVRREVPA